MKCWKLDCNCTCVYACKCPLILAMHGSVTADN